MKKVINENFVVLIKVIFHSQKQKHFDKISAFTSQTYKIFLLIRRANSTYIQQLDINEHSNSTVSSMAGCCYCTRAGPNDARRVQGRAVKPLYVPKVLGPIFRTQRDFKCLYFLFKRDATCNG